MNGNNLIGLDSHGTAVCACIPHNVRAMLN